ncbi:MAG: hypothetical protein KKE04_03570 [Candidatus Thermoplasmatota archaeon]|nr:hypothetical protein [Candidatus Thermoplasmatota archaeon]
MEDIAFFELEDEEKKLLLDTLGFEVNKKGVIVEKESKKPCLCPITDKMVHFENASILPGSTTIINTSPFTLTEYFSKFLEKE